MIGLNRRRGLMGSVKKEIGTLVASAVMNAADVRTIEVYGYDSALGAFECSDISDLGATTSNVYVIPKNDSVGCLVNWGGIRDNLTKVDDTHFTFQNQITGQATAANTLCIISKPLVIHIGSRHTETIEYRLDFEGCNNASAYYIGGPYSQPIDTGTSIQPSGASNKAYKCKKSVWFSVYWSGSTFYVTTHRVKQKVWKLTQNGGVIDEAEYTDERTVSSFGTNDVTPYFFIDRCYGLTTAKLYQL